MRIVVIGAGGIIGRAIVAGLRGHDVIEASRTSVPISVDLTEPASIASLYREVAGIDAVISAAGAAAFGPLAQLEDDDFAMSLGSKLMGQVNLIRQGFAHVREGGSITVTSGALARTPMHGSAAVSLVNAGLEGFVRAAALEAPRAIRVNVVSPPWVSETLRKLNMDPSGGLPAEVVARAYVDCVTATMTGSVIEPTA